MKAVLSLWDWTYHLLCAQDAHGFQKCRWVAKKYISPVWKVERDFGRRPGSIKVVPPGVSAPLTGGGSDLTILCTLLQLRIVVTRNLKGLLLGYNASKGPSDRTSPLANARGRAHRWSGLGRCEFCVLGVIIIWG